MRLLLYGDSLTAGYHSNGLRFSPWAPALRALLPERPRRRVRKLGWPPQRRQVEDNLVDVAALVQEDGGHAASVAPRAKRVHEGRIGALRTPARAGDFHKAL